MLALAGYLDTNTKNGTMARSHIQGVHKGGDGSVCIEHVMGHEDEVWFC